MTAGNLSVSADDPDNVTTALGNLALTGDLSYSDDLVANTNTTMSGNPTISAGSFNMDVKYADVIICRRDPSAP